MTCEFIHTCYESFTKIKPNYKYMNTSKTYSMILIPVFNETDEV